MSTKAGIIVQDVDDGNRTTAVIYKHWDGYPEHVIALLRDKFCALHISRGPGLGFGQDDKFRYANGIDCFAATLVSVLKTKAGGIYLYPSDCVGDFYCDFLYVLTVPQAIDELWVDIYSGNEIQKERRIYSGLLNDWEAA